MSHYPHLGKDKASPFCLLGRNRHTKLSLVKGKAEELSGVAKCVELMKIRQSESHGLLLSEIAQHSRRKTHWHKNLLSGIIKNNFRAIPTVSGDNEEQ